MHGIKGEDFRSQIKAKADSFIDSLGRGGAKLKCYAVSLSLAQDIMMSAVSRSHCRILIAHAQLAPKLAVTFLLQRGDFPLVLWCWGVNSGPHTC